MQNFLYAVDNAILSVYSSFATVHESQLSDVDSSLVIVRANIEALWIEKKYSEVKKQLEDSYLLTSEETQKNRISLILSDLAYVEMLNPSYTDSQGHVRPHYNQVSFPTTSVVEGITDEMEFLASLSNYVELKVAWNNFCSLVYPDYSLNGSPTERFSSLIETANALLPGRDDVWNAILKWEVGDEETIIAALSELRANYESQTQYNYCRTLADRRNRLIKQSEYASIYGIEKTISASYELFSELNTDYHSAWALINNQIEAMTTVPPTLAQDNLGNKTYYCTLKSQYRNYLGDLPQGKYSITYQEDGTYSEFAELNKYKLNIVSSSGKFNSLTGEQTEDLQVYPPSLTYFANSYLVDAGSSSPTTTDRWEQSYSASEPACSYESRNMAVRHLTNYGVSQLRTHVTYDNFKLSCLTKESVQNSDGSYKTSTLREASLTKDSIYLSGLLIGNQPRRVGFDFMPVGSSLCSLYDRYMGNVKLIAQSDVYGKSYTFDNTMSLPMDENVYAYTLTLPTRQLFIGEKDTLTIALELINNTRQTLIGKNNQPVLPASPFYMVGRIIYDYSQGNQKVTNQIFTSDYHTTANIKMADYSYSSGTPVSLYATVPDPNNSEIDFSLYITTEYSQGIYGSIEIGK